MTLPNLQSFNWKVVQGDEVSYVEPATSQAAGTFQVPVAVPISGSGGTNYAINLATLFPGLTPANAMVLTVEDVSSPGIGFYIRGESGSSSTGFQIRPGSLMTAGIDTFGTIYIDNLSATLPLNLEISITGS
jgi:hypothetical protein